MRALPIIWKRTRITAAADLSGIPRHGDPGTIDNYDDDDDHGDCSCNGDVEEENKSGHGLDSNNSAADGLARSVYSIGLYDEAFSTYLPVVIAVLSILFVRA